MSSLPKTKEESPTKRVAMPGPTTSLLPWTLEECHAYAERAAAAQKRVAHAWRERSVRSTLHPQTRASVADSCAAIERAFDVLDGPRKLERP
jgi:hypothetical protein